MNMFTQKLPQANMFSRESQKMPGLKDELVCEAHSYWCMHQIFLLQRSTSYRLMGERWNFLPGFQGIDVGSPLKQISMRVCLDDGMNTFDITNTFLPFK